MTIDERALRAAYAELRARIAYIEKHTGLFVDEKDLERRGADPVVRFVPRGWRGDPELMKGKAFSQCPPDFLDHLAGALRSMAARPPKDPAKDFRAKNLDDAALARSWARKLRAAEAAKARAAAAAAAPGTSSPDEDFIP